MTLSVMELIDQGADHLVDWIAMAQSNQDRVLHDANWWLGLAEAAAFNATTDDDATTDPNLLIKWAYAAIQVYDHLAQSIAPKGQNGFECSGMFLRAAMIERLGIVPGHSVLDPDVVQKWFFDRVTFSREEVLARSKNWKDLPIEQIQQLRYLKNRLSVIEFFVKEEYLQDNELIEWIQIRAMLP